MSRLQAVVKIELTVSHADNDNLPLEERLLAESQSVRRAVVEMINHGYPVARLLDIEEIS